MFASGNNAKAARPPHPPAPAARVLLSVCRRASPRWGEGISALRSNAIALLPPRPRQPAPGAWRQAAGGGGLAGPAHRMIAAKGRGGREHGPERRADAGGGWPGDPGYRRRPRPPPMFLAPA